MVITIMLCAGLAWFGVGVAVAFLNGTFVKANCRFLLCTGSRAAGYTASGREMLNLLHL